MSHPQRVRPALFFIALTARDFSLKNQILKRLEDLLGMVVLEGPVYEFSKFTSYYEEEMGYPLFKTILFFEILKDPEELVELKHLCYEIEKEHSQDGKRLVNLDPGYLTLSKVILSTFKDYAHRVYLGRSVFAEVEYIFKEGSFRPLPWTYPDYQEPMIISAFNQAREIYKGKLKCL
jgi:hypothetical protein